HGFLWGGGLGLMGNSVVAGKMAEKEEKWGSMFGREHCALHSVLNGDGDRVWTMDTTIDQQVAMNEALVPHARRLRIGRSNFRLLSDISSKESTLQLVYDVMRLTPFFKAFLVTANVEHKDTKKSNEMYYPRFTKLKLANKRSLQQTHISQASGSGANEGTGYLPGVPDVPTDEFEEEISWNSTDEEGDDDNDDEGDDGEEGN
nr:hypothetical protein [Tanacetum cinerariifolium]